MTPIEFVYHFATVAGYMAGFMAAGAIALSPLLFITGALDWVMDLFSKEGV